MFDIHVRPHITQPREVAGNKEMHICDRLICHCLVAEQSRFVYLFSPCYLCVYHTTSYVRVAQVKCLIILLLWEDEYSNLNLDVCAILGKCITFNTVPIIVLLRQENNI